MSGATDEGYIKFHCEWIAGPPPADDEVAELSACRDLLHSLDLIGEYPDGVGYGNVSVRGSGQGMIVSGTQTGGVGQLNATHFTRVVAYDIERNRLTCIGPVRASSESLTHAAIYECDPMIGAVVHVHSLEAWERLVGAIPTTRADVPYGTPEMARELLRLYRESELPTLRVAAMAGHREGIIAFGPTPADATDTLLSIIGTDGF
jgi:L-ribulose-5-phosphate 4-epimerase